MTEQGRARTCKAVQSAAAPRLPGCTCRYAGHAGWQRDRQVSLCYNAPVETKLDSPSKLRSFADRFGATASFLCALHCALLPAVIALLPALGVGFLADHAFERAFVIFSVALAVTSLFFGFRRHHRLAAFLFMVPGVLLLIAGVIFAGDHGNVFHAALVSLGGVLVMCSHIANLRLAHSHAHTRECGCAPDVGAT